MPSDTAKNPHRRLSARLCRHWRDCGILGGGCCRQGRYGGKPSLGTCRVCPSYSGRPRGWGDVVYLFANPVARILNAVLALKSNKQVGHNCRCAQRRREWNATKGVRRLFNE